MFQRLNCRSIQSVQNVFRKVIRRHVSIDSKYDQNTFVKIINKGIDRLDGPNTNSLLYKSGLNTSYYSQGIKFMDIKTVTQWTFACKNDTSIFIVKIPEDSRVKQICSGKWNVWQSNQIILSEEFPYYDLDTVKKLNFPITTIYINDLCKLGKTDILDHSVKINKHLDYNEDALYYASKYGHTNVLDWWLASGLPLIYDTEYIYLHVTHKIFNNDVVKWWLNSGLPLSPCNEHSKYKCEYLTLNKDKENQTQANDMIKIPYIVLVAPQNKKLNKLKL
jgi:hypothetical protein